MHFWFSFFWHALLHLFFDIFVNRIYFNSCLGILVATAGIIVFFKTSWICPTEPPRLQLERGLFWYRRYPKIHEIVSDWSSRVDFLTSFREMSMRVFFNSKKCGKMILWSTRNQMRSFFAKKNFEKISSYQSCNFSDTIYLNWVNLIICIQI